ncbi:hypothetical protein BBJ28_00022139, partial [Nothophytophthora sp. Chile5]
MDSSTEASATEQKPRELERPAPMSHRAVDALRQAPVVELHRSSSGRNLRLKHMSLGEGSPLAAPNALTPRAPSGKRPGNRQPPFSSIQGDNNNDESTSCHGDRRSSFSISAHALKELEMERARSVTDPAPLADLGGESEEPEQFEDEYESDEDVGQQQESGESEGEQWGYEADEGANNREEAESHNWRNLDSAAEQQEDKAVSRFGLWDKAAKNKCIPDAIIFSSTSNGEVQQASSRSSFPSSSVTGALGLRRGARAEPRSVQTACDMVSQLQVAHPSLAALAALHIPDALSLTRSTSPRIGRSTASLVSGSARAVPTVATEREEVIQPTATAISNPITSWKRGVLVGEGTFGKVALSSSAVFMGLNSITGELFALKQIEIHTRPNADQVTQMQKLEEEIALMNNLCHKHIVRSVSLMSIGVCNLDLSVLTMTRLHSSYKGSHRTTNHFYIFMEYVPGGSIA